MAENEFPSKPGSTIEIDKEILKDSKVSTNIAQDIIVTTVDKAKLCLIEHQKTLSAKDGWIAPLGIIIPVIAALVTADFTKQFIGLGPAIWQAIFILSAIGSFVWLLLASYHAIDAAQRGGLDDLIDKLKARPK